MTDATTGPEVGDAAPTFVLASPEGEVGLSDFDGQTVVLYFYPRDDTPGCTAQAKDFTDMAAEFDAAGAKVLGVSKDTVEKHESFSAKHDLTVTLLSDVQGQVCEQYGTWVEKQMYGKTSMGIERATFLIDGKGVIREVWRKVKVPGHVEEVLEAARKLPR